MGYKVLLKKRDDGGFKATVPTLPGCISSGINEEETLERIQSEILLHLGIEEVSQAKNWKDVAYYRYRLKQCMTVNMSQERKFAATTTLAGLFFMIGTIWGARILFP